MNNKRKITILAILILILISVPFHFANAQVGWLMNALADEVVFLTFGWMLALIKAILVGLIGLMGTSADTMLNMPVETSGVIQNAWNLVRQFTNMFFIVIMVIMAFYTIFDLGGYDFKSLIGKFIVAALLINFSLVIGGVIIGISQTISDVFIQAIGSVGDRLAQGSDLSDRFQRLLTDSQAPTQPVNLNFWQESLKSFADIILLGILFFSMAVLFVMTLIRIPFLWALLIFSPVAWITYILPSTKKINQDWWKYFIGWNVFFPVYLFFVYIGVFLLSNRDQVLSAPQTAKLMGIGFEDIFFYILIAMVLIGGAKMAMSAGMAAGAGGIALGVWGKGKAMARFAGTRIPVFGGYSYRDIQAAGKERLAQAKREGVLGMFGEEQAARRQGALAERFGVRDAREKQLADDINIYKKRYANYDEDQLRQQMTQGQLYERLAARELLNQRGQLRGNEATETYRMYGDAGSTTKAREFIRSLDMKRFSPGERQELYDSIAGGDLLSRQKIANTQIESGDITDGNRLIELTELLYPDPADMQQRLELLKRNKEAIKNLHSSQRRVMFDRATDEIKAFVGELMNEEKELKVDVSRGIDELNDVVEIIKRAHGALDNNNQPTGQFLNKLGKFADSARKYNAVKATDLKLTHGIIRDAAGNITDGLLKDSDGVAFDQSDPGQRTKALEAEIRKLDDQDLLRQGKAITEDANARNALTNTLTPGRIDHLTSRVGASRGQLDTLKPVFNQVRQTGNLQYIREKKGPALSKTINRLKEITQQVEEAVRTRDPALNNIMRMARDSAKSEIINARKIVNEMRGLALPPANEGMKQAAQAGLDKAIEAFNAVAR